MFGRQNAPRGWFKGSFCTAEDRKLETVGTRASSMLQKVKRYKHEVNEVNCQATEQWLKTIFYLELSPTNTTRAVQKGHCAGKEKFGKQQRDWMTHATWQQNESNFHTAEDKTRMHGRAKLRVKHRCQESSPGQQVIKKYLQLWNLPRMAPCMPDQ